NDARAATASSRNDRSSSVAIMVSFPTASPSVTGRVSIKPAARKAKFTSRVARTMPGKARKFAAEGATTSEKTGRRTDDAGSCAETGNVDNAIAKKMRGNDLMASSPRRRLPAPDTADTRQHRQPVRLPQVPC